MLLAIILLTIGTTGYVTMIFRKRRLRTLKDRINDPIFMIAFVVGLTCTLWGIIELQYAKEEKGWSTEIPYWQQK